MVLRGVTASTGPVAALVASPAGARPLQSLPVWAQFLLAVLVFAMTMMAGLLVSLLVRRRRIWIRITPGGPGTVNVELGGLARHDLMEPVHPQIDEVEEPVRVPERPLGKYEPRGEPFGFTCFENLRHPVLTRLHCLKDALQFAVFGFEQ